MVSDVGVGLHAIPACHQPMTFPHLDLNDPYQVAACMQFSTKPEQGVADDPAATGMIQAAAP